MSHPYAPPASAAPNRPSISDVETGPDGRWFTIMFEPGQVLPSHRNARPIEIMALEGDGILTAPSCGSRRLAAGESVQLAPHEVHDVVSGPHGFRIRVRLTSTTGEAR